MIAINNAIEAMKSKKVLFVILLLFIGIFLGLLLIASMPVFIVAIIASKLVPGVVKFGVGVVGWAACNKVSSGIGDAIGGEVDIGFGNINPLNPLEKGRETLCTFNKLLNITDQAGLNDKVKAAFDCYMQHPSYTPIENENCAKNAIGNNDKPASIIPKEALWLVPIYQSAAEKYKVPWEVLAAVNGARTNFDLENCSDNRGVGFYHMPADQWKRYQVDAGHATTQATGGCRSTAAPYKINKHINSSGPGDPYDAVDAIYTEARLLSDKGAQNKDKWAYTGSPANNCIAPPSDGDVYYPPVTAAGDVGSGAHLGFNKKLIIPREILLEAAKWRSDKGPLRPRREDAMGSGPAPVMPKALLVKMMRVAWEAFGVKGQKLSSYVTQNYAQIGRESGGKPYILQGHIGDVNDNNPAGGLFQFIPGTFNSWKVDGFNDRFNPFDNILATVNAQVNSGMGYILDGHSGWGPGNGTNPYKSGGHSQIVSNPGSTGDTKPVPYKGEAQTDGVSKAVSYQFQSQCYVAVVNDWYEAIKNNPPPSSAFAGDLRARIVEIAQRELKLIGGKNDNGNLAPYVGKYCHGGHFAWCMCFATWVWQQAGVKVPNFTVYNETANWGRPKGLFHPYGSKYKPLPGDHVVFSHGHVGIVEKVSGNTVTSIDGNYSESVTRHIDDPGDIMGYVSPPAQTGPGAQSNSPNNLNAKLDSRWGGTQTIFEQLITPYMKKQGLSPGSQKRSYDTVDPGMSDHYVGCKTCYATDYPTTNGAKIANSLARSLGISGYSVGNYVRHDIVVDGKAYSVQILWAVPGHYDHVHVGVRRDSIKDPVGKVTI